MAAMEQLCDMNFILISNNVSALITFKSQTCMLLDLIKKFSNEKDACEAGSSCKMKQYYVFEEIPGPGKNLKLRVSCIFIYTDDGLF